MKIISLCIIALLVSINCQTVDVEDNVEVGKESTTQETQEGAEPKKMTAEEQQIETTKNIFYSCIVVTRNYLSLGAEVAENLKAIADTYGDAENPEQQKDQQLKVYKRLYIDHVKNCANVQTPDGAMQIYKALYASKFDPRDHFYLVNEVDLNVYKNKSVITDFDNEEEMLWKMMEEFEKKIKESNEKEDTGTAPKSGRERREEREAREAKEGKGSKDSKNQKNGKTQDFSDYEPKMFGASMKSGSRFMEIIFLFGVFGVFFLVLFAGFKILTKEDQPKDKKKSKKDKKLE